MVSGVVGVASAWARIFSGSLATAAIVASLLSAPATASVRSDVIDANFVPVLLTAKAGQGALSWDASAASDDDVDLKTNTLGAFHDFISPPLARTLYLNVSRPIQLDIFFKGSTKQDINVELYAGDVLLTGGFRWYTDDVFYNDACCLPAAPTSSRPTAPGYAASVHRMQAELSELAKGTVLRLRVISASDSVKTYGLQDPHRSILWIPVFSTDEMVFRAPKYQADAETSDADAARDPKAGNQGGGWPLAGLALIVGAAAIRPPRRVVWMVLVVLVSGCVQGPKDGRSIDTGPDGDGGARATSYIIPDTDNETGLANASTGSILGVVSDPEGLPLGEAHVLLIETSFFTRSDTNGRFRFPTMEPGPYRLRIDRAEFRSLELDIRVEPASVTKVEVALDYADPRAGNQRPHRHDGWLGETRAVLLDGPAPNSVVELEAPSIVLPGTVTVEINVTWNGGGVRMLRTRLPSETSQLNYTFLYPRASGVPFRVSTTWETTDPGHASYTYWGSFQAFAPIVEPCANPVALYCSLFPNDPGTRMRITIYKGPVPLEPPHIDRWGGATQVTVLANLTQTFKRQCAYVFVFACPLSPRTTALTTTQTDQGRFIAPDPYNASWFFMGFVPFETRTVDFHLTASREALGTSSTTPWRLYYRDASSTNRGTCDPAADVNIKAAKAPKLITANPAQKTWHWRAELDGGGDPPYAKKSTWCVFLSPADTTAELIDDYGSATKLPVFTIYMVATREPTSST